MLSETKGLSGMTAGEKTAYTYSRFLETGAWKSLSEAQQKEFWKAVKEQKIPEPLPKPRPLGKDRRGRELETYTPEEYRAYRQREAELGIFERESDEFRIRRERLRSEKREDDISGEIEEERNRRIVIGKLRGRAMGKYEGNPVWDDVVPIPQDDGEGALAQIAYTDEYAEGMSIYAVCVLGHV